MEPPQRVGGPSISRWNDRADREIDIGYRCVTARRSNVLIGQSDFSGAGCSKDRRNDLARNALALARTRTTATRFTLYVKSSMARPIPHILTPQSPP